MNQQDRVACQINLVRGGGPAWPDSDGPTQPKMHRLTPQVTILEGAAPSGAPFYPLRNRGRFRPPYNDDA